MKEHLTREVPAMPRDIHCSSAASFVNNSNPSAPMTARTLSVTFEYQSQERLDNKLPYSTSSLPTIGCMVTIFIWSGIMLQLGRKRQPSFVANGQILYSRVIKASSKMKEAYHERCLVHLGVRGSK